MVRGRGVPCLNAHRIHQNEFRRQYGPDYRSDLDLIFCNPDGTPLKPDSISGSVADVPGPGLQASTPCAAVTRALLLADGVDLATVSERLGHSSVATTAAIYSHALRGKDRAAAQVWDDIMQRARAETSTVVN